jgi:hypothetical protein
MITLSPMTIRSNGFSSTRNGIVGGVLFWGAARPETARRFQNIAAE